MSISLYPQRILGTFKNGLDVAVPMRTRCRRQLFIPLWEGSRSLGGFFQRRRQNGGRVPMRRSTASGSKVLSTASMSWASIDKSFQVLLDPKEHTKRRLA